MAAYIVLSPNGRAHDPDCRFVRDGFSWLAALFPVIHAIVHGLIIDALVLVAVRAFGLAFLAAGETRAVGFVLLVASSLIYGFEARRRLADNLSRRGWKTERVITAQSLADAEAIHYGEDDAVSPDDPMFKLGSETSRSPTQRPAAQFGMIDFQKGR
ncbi:DUF2628 domain-containing protein [Rhizobium sp. C4]|uniref:DUF2628 domain-containing protein n=1 Tax=Rhizobium sp. C4 TaxID=1349800 RepID=UPI001E4ADA9E|nr:DUF2628 domain-containing protein [Rhizobium sp. C4]MCD2174653.1 DUF2628 domain-containing protein [Rhizobium sp. C4]